jgi:hypothetical protein
VPVLGVPACDLDSEKWFGNKSNSAAKLSPESRTPMSYDIQPFRIAATDSQLDDLKRRLRETRWPERECVDDWSQGLPLAYAQEVVAYWLEDEPIVKHRDNLTSFSNQ